MNELIQRSATHESQRHDLNDPPIHHALELCPRSPCPLRASRRGRRYGSTFSARSPGKKAEGLSPASTAGRDRMMRLTSLARRALRRPWQRQERSYLYRQGRHKRPGRSSAPSCSTPSGFGVRARMTSCLTPEDNRVELIRHSSTLGVVLERPPSTRSMIIETSVSVSFPARFSVYGKFF